MLNCVELDAWEVAVRIANFGNEILIAFGEKWWIEYKVIINFWIL